MLAIAREPPHRPEVADLIRQSDALSASLYPAESRHPVDLDALAGPDARFFVARRDGRALGCGAFILGHVGGRAELKRLFVEPAARGQGVGRALLARIEREARREGVTLLQLETGVSQPEALGLYRALGYVERGPFGAYRPDPLSVFMEKRL